MKNEPNATEGLGNDIASQAAPMLDRATEQASAMAHRGVDALQESAQQLREKAAQTGDVTKRYIQNDPIKAVLIAAASGAALMALLGLLGRSRAH